MFAGIVEEQGQVERIRVEAQAAARMSVACSLVAKDTRIGDSISVNGVCLTVVAVEGANLSFDAVPETMRRTNLGELKAGDCVNLERSLPATGRIGGHFVLGHVDGVGVVQTVAKERNATVFAIAAPDHLMWYVAEKGSVAVDGVSLTVADISADAFSVWIIPHTFGNTTFGQRNVGDTVNVEVDVLARYVEKALAARLGGTTASSSLTLEKLRDTGYI